MRRDLEFILEDSVRVTLLRFADQHRQRPTPPPGVSFGVRQLAALSPVITGSSPATPRAGFTSSLSNFERQASGRTQAVLRSAAWVVAQSIAPKELRPKKDTGNGGTGVVSNAYAE
jgi:hypothetical protein